MLPLGTTEADEFPFARGVTRLRHTSWGFVATDYCFSSWVLEAVEVLGSATSMCVPCFLSSREVLDSLF